MFLLHNGDDNGDDDGDDDGNDHDEEGSNSKGVDVVAQKTLLWGRTLCRSHTVIAPCSSFSQPSARSYLESFRLYHHFT